jgi:hypothetical protein
MSPIQAIEKSCTIVMSSQEYELAAFGDHDRPKIRCAKEMLALTPSQGSVTVITAS